MLLRGIDTLTLGLTPDIESLASQYHLMVIASVTGILLEVYYRVLEINPNPMRIIKESLVTLNTFSKQRGLGSLLLTNLTIGCHSWLGTGSKHSA